MKYLKLQFTGARLIKEKNLKNMLGSNRFFYPINKLHIYNSFCVLLGRTPKPQLRETNDKYLPVFDDVMTVVNDGYIQIKLVQEGEKITTIKKDWNSNITEAKQYTWKDCTYILGTLLPVFIWHISELLNKSEAKVKEMPFESIISLIQSLGIQNETTKEIIYDNEKVNLLIKWCQLNSSTGLSNYIENKQVGSKPVSFGKRVYRGCVEVNRYCGFIYIPLTNELHSELEKETKGFSTLLDGGLVKIIGYDYLNEDDIIGFTEISNLNPVRKFDKLTTGVDWSNTIYRSLTPQTLTEDIVKIIESTGISISDNQKEYDEMMKKINKENFDGTNFSKVAYKINYFIESVVNSQYS